MLLLTCLFVGIGLVTAQITKVTGTVISEEDGLPVVGASILVKGTTVGTVTDMDGKFTLSNVPSSAKTLVVSFIGMATQEVAVKANLNIVLKSDTEQLEEVMVVAYGTAKKSAFTGSAATIKNEKIATRQTSNVTNALAGQVAGVQTTSNNGQPGKDAEVRIRGIGSISASNKPLYVVDGVPYDGEISAISTSDIESMTVLKDAASAAIYGARAAGGVILVTTKRPKGETSFQLNYNNNFAFATAMNLPEQAPLMEYLQAYSDAAGDQFWTMGSPSVSKWMGYLEQYRNNPSSIPTVGDGIFKDTDGAVYYMNEKDLVKNMLETSFQHTHNISMTGGTDKLRYRLSAGFIDNDGVLITDKDKYRRMNVSGFISANVTKWFTQEATFSYAHSKRMEPKSALGAVYSTRLASFYPEGNMPEGISAAGDGLPFFTPSNQIRWSNPEKHCMTILVFS